MKKLIVFVLCAILLSSCTVVRPSGSDDLFRYSVKDGQAVITEYIGRKKQVTVPAQFRGYPVTEIADDVFKDKIYITEVLFEGQNLRRIGKQVFYGTSISRIVFPDSLRTLGDEAFAESDRLQSVTFLGKVESIGQKAFYKCSALENVYFSDRVGEVGACAFLKCSELSDINLQNVDRFGELSFGACYGLSGDVILSAIEIGDRAFIACEHISSIQIENAEKIGTAAFSECKALTRATLSGQIKNIPESCFEGCDCLTQLISAPLEKVGAYAFHQCLALTDVSLADSAEIYASSIKNSGVMADCIDDDDAVRVIDGRTYTRTFYDEFDGNELDLQKWRKCPEWQRRDAYWRDNESYVENGNLVLTVSSGPHPDREGRTAFFSGAVRTAETFAQKYGYFEIRCKLSDLSGFWSAFWLMPTAGASMSNENSDGTANDGAEIDIYESPFADSESVNYAVHWDGYGANHHSIGAMPSKTGLYMGYHTFALKWTEEEYVFYIDDEEMWRITDPTLISHVSSYMKVTVEVGTWAGSVTAEEFPICALLTDYVKVYA